MSEPVAEIKGWGGGGASRPPLAPLLDLPLGTTSLKTPVV